MDVGEQGDCIPIATLSPPECWCIKMGSIESHFNVSVGCERQSHKTVSTNHDLSEEIGEPKRYRIEVLPLTSLTPYRLGQTSSRRSRRWKAYNYSPSPGGPWKAGLGYDIKTNTLGGSSSYKKGNRDFGAFLSYGSSGWGKRVGRERSVLLIYIRQTQRLILVACPFRKHPYIL